MIAVCFHRTCGMFVEQPEDAIMLRFFRYLYWADDIREKDRDRIKWYLKVHRKKCFVYCVTLCEGTDQLEIYFSPVLLQGFYRRNPPLVIGIAHSYETAVELVRQIAEECYRQNGDADLKRYLAQRTEKTE